jgi:lipopolysaccharide/colanic/teichoic acid biosynthesis glycosyltransferase
MMAGIGAVVIALGKAHAVTHGYDFSASSRFAWSLAYIGLLILAAYGAGLPDLTRSIRSAVLGAFGSTTAAAVGISLVQLLVGSAVLPRYVVLGTWLVATPFLVLCATVARHGRFRDRQRDRVLAVLNHDEGVHLRDELKERPERPAQLVGLLSLEDAMPARAGERPLVDAAVSAGATTLVLDRHAQADDLVVAQAAELHEAGIRIRTLSLFYDHWLGKLPVSELERISLLFDIGELHRSRYGRIKRVMDIAAALGGSVVLLAVLPAVWLGNRFGNRGPLLYSQPRVGKGGTVFKIYKFRTMRPGGGATSWTTSGDPRVTPFGRWLRRSHLDELPQVANILRGDLSIVGPRPEQPQYVTELGEKIPFYRLRHLVRPGLTGWAQVKYPYGASELDALEKLQYEFFYLRHQSLALDLRIITRTIRIIVGRAGR